MRMQALSLCLAEVHQHKPQALLPEHTTRNLLRLISLQKQSNPHKPSRRYFQTYGHAMLDYPSLGTVQFIRFQQKGTLCVTRPAQA
jgi:hypothetical protein